MAKVTAQTLVPIGAIVAAVLMTVGVMRIYAAEMPAVTCFPAEAVSSAREP